MTKRRPNAGGRNNGGVNEHCPEKVRFFVFFACLSLSSRGSKEERVSEL